MPAGRSPPILPRLNPLTAGHSAGRKPPMPYKFAMQRMRERQRLAKGMKQIAAIGGAVGGWEGAAAGALIGGTAGGMTGRARRSYYTGTPYYAPARAPRGWGYY